MSDAGLAKLTAAADGSHLSGAMIALMPTPEDAARLVIEGGETAEQLHLTLRYLGKGADFSDEARQAVIDAVTDVLPHYVSGPVTAKAFGAAHWNGNSDEPCWVWSVGDDPETPRTLGMLHGAIAMALEEGLNESVDHPELPEPHTPFAPHICAAYSNELDLIIALEERLGPVTFDRVRVAFAGDHTDIPLGGDVAASARVLPSRWDDDVVHVEVETNHGGSVLLDAMRAATEGLAAELGVPVRVTGRTRTTARTAAAGPLRRQPTELEIRSRVDFAQMDKAWHEAVDATVEAWSEVQAAQREQITAAVKAAAEADDLSRLDEFTVDTSDGARLLIARMIGYAREAGEQQQAEAEAQGVNVPEWSLDDEALTAAAIRDRLRQIGRTAARVLGVGLVQSAVRQAMRVWGSGSAAQVAAQVDEHLASLSGAAVEEQVGAAMTAAQNEGRMAVLAVAPPAEYTATEILDRNSCSPCRDIDGTRYTNLPDARAAYPSGGYTGCLGGARCRGTLVTVWPQEGEQAAAAGMILAASADTMPHQTTDQEGTMPYRVEQDHPDCGADTPWAVVKEADSELMGCHESEAAALEQMAALYAAENDEEPADDGDANMDYAGETAPWEGVLAVEGIVTGDGREFAPDALTWADLPVPLRWNIEDSHGGEARTKAVNVGRIDKVWRDGNRIMGAGVLDLSDDNGRRAYDKIKGEFLRGVSIDADSISDADVEFVWPEDANAGAEGDGDDDLFEMLFAQPEKVIFHGGRIRAATLVDIPAFAEAYIALLDAAGAVVAGGQPVGEAAVQTLAASTSTPGRALRTVTASSPTAHPAMASLWKPPSEWFKNPELPFYCGIVVTDQGRLYGHAAPWGACHIGFDGECVTVPRESEHSHYMTGETVCDDGSRVAVGQITVGTGHAPLHFGAQPAAEHYDNTGTAVADVAVGNDKHGIWVAGAIRPNADPLSVYELRASGRVSGDWRRIGGQLRMVGLLGVNVAGFLEEAKMRTLVSSGRPQALVAAGVPKQRWAMSKDEMERQAVRVVMRMLSRRVHPGRG
jgi:2'-5' RNA ligase